MQNKAQRTIDIVEQVKFYQKAYDYYFAAIKLGSPVGKIFLAVFLLYAGENNSKLSQVLLNQIIDWIESAGSVGWALRSDDNIYLKYASYLQYLRPNGINIFDKNEPKTYTDSDPLLICPNYLKQLDNRFVLKIWNQAQDALSVSSEVTFVGYSLPDADVAIRALLNPLRTNAEKIFVLCPSDSTAKKRWQTFF